MNKIIYSKDEKEIRYYNVFKNKKNNKIGLDLIVTNKRLITINYDESKGQLSQQVSELPLSEINGILTTSYLSKFDLRSVIICMALGVISLIAILCGGFLGLGEFDDTLLCILVCLPSILFIAIGVLQIIFPRKEGNIKIPHKANYKGINIKSSLALKLINDNISLINVVPGNDFELLQREIGAVIESAKNNLEI